MSVRLAALSGSPVTLAFGDAWGTPRRPGAGRGGRNQRTRHRVLVPAWTSECDNVADALGTLFAVMSRGTCELHTSIIAVAWKRRMKAGWRGKEQPAAPPLAALPQLASCKQPHGGACPGPRCAHTT